MERVPSPASQSFEDKSRHHIIQSDNSPDSAELAQLGLDWFNESVKPRLEQASNDDRFLSPALGEWVDWLGAMAVLGVDSANFQGPPDLSVSEDEARHLAIGGLLNAVLQAADRAKDTNNLQYLSDAIEWSAQAELLGLTDDAPGLGVNTVLENFPLTVDVFELSFPSSLAVGGVGTLSAKAAPKIGDNDPLAGIPVAWAVTVDGGTVSGMTNGETNSEGGFATSIQRTDQVFEITIRATYLDSGITLAESEDFVLKPAES